MIRRYVVSGSVQGVGYRHFVRGAARRMNIRGWVRNLPDGNVEAVAEADPDVLALFETDLKSGPMLSSVADVSASDWTGELPNGFEVRG